MRQGVAFGRYKRFKLKPIRGIKMHPLEDGTIHPGDIALYQDAFRRDWRFIQGGLMYAMGENREFWNCVLNWHSIAHTTGCEEWDALFETLKADGYRKDTLTCMFFNMPSGCRTYKCPFRHDIATAEEARERVLNTRREVMRKPTARQFQAHFLALDKRRRPGYSEEDAEAEHLTECQKLDWKRHKKEPCSPLEEIIREDWSWDKDERKGTTMMEEVSKNTFQFDDRPLKYLGTE
ncbi:hypothetical protein EVG20_g3033 [Dentipellis fragilis]|uniref:C3H1-type domain-containing protein n=1 Tax=Dentipellis fragilis TaxID=205917 RepID=A0A4Y9Z4V2_9AGAM|nr:hypothetical protein EVG20_g3033 [Dentipellis fragilis]